VTSFIATLVDTIIPTVKVRAFSNQKPWVEGSIRTALNARTAAYNASLVSGNISKYKAASYGLRRAMNDTKRKYKDRVEAQLDQRDTRHLWQGLRIITDYWGSTPSTVSADASLADDLNSFYVQFEASNTYSGTYSIARDEHTLCEEEGGGVRRALMRVNARKSAGPDGMNEY